MPKLRTFNDAALADLLGEQHTILTRRQALDCGMTDHMLRRRLRPGGPWRVLLPGVYLALAGLPTAVQREMAALLYAGPVSLITGPAALFRHGVRVAHTEFVDVLVPTSTQRRNLEFVRMHRSTRMPELMHVRDGLRYVPVARAVADSARAMQAIGDVRAVVADAVQRGRCPLDVIAGEARSGPSRGSALLRQAVAEVGEGIRSATEGDFRGLIKHAGLPMPMFNPSLYAGGRFIARPDCWWPDAGVAAEADSREWHLSPREWERTLARHALMSAHGIVVLHFTPQQIRTQAATVVANLRAALEAGRRRPPLAIEAVRCDGERGTDD
jgi:hypothetical protein